MAFFNYWNMYRFPKDFIIIRDEVMKLSKIGSKSTYHRCLKQLDSWKYIQYIPSHNSFKGSRIRLFIFRTTSGQPLDSAVPKSGQPLVSYINSIKQIESINKQELPKNEKEVISFFSKNKWPKIEAQKFFAHYKSIGWKIGGKIKMADWHASAKSWMLKAEELNLKRSSPVSQNQLVRRSFSEGGDNRRTHASNNLKTTKSKNYKEPL